MSPLIAFAVAAITTIAATGVAGAAEDERAPLAGIADVHVWERWEQSFESTSSYGNPYEEVEIDLRWTAPSGANTRSPGFWDGGSTWAARFAFPEPGTWTYITECSNAGDTGLHNQTGQVHVLPYGGTNPLYARGFPTADGGERSHLQYWDGEPFLYFADTLWFPWGHSSAADWQDYVDNRAAKGFTVIQTSLGFDNWWDKWSAGGCDGTGTDGLRPWFGPVGTAERYNPEFFAVVDAYIEFANQRGLVVSVFGLMNAGRHNWLNDADRRRYARTVSARLQGSAVIFSPPVDDKWFREALMTDVGAYLRANEDIAYPHLLAAHMETNAYNCDNVNQPGNYACDLHGESWVDFGAYQSGHNAPQGDEMILWSVRRAREMPLEYSARSPRKPVINVEPLYSMPPSWFPPDADLDDNAYRCRQIGYYTFLSGGAGHAYGIWGIWDFGRYQLGHCSSPAVDWRDAAENVFSQQATHTLQLLRSVPWHRLSPRHDMILNQTANERRKMVLALAPDDSLLVAYVPRGNAAIRINTQDFRGGVTEWFDPRTGERQDGASWSGESPSVLFETPDSGEDWVLLVEVDYKPPTTETEAIQEVPGAAVRALALAPARPNPFSATTAIEFDVRAAGPARLAIYDVAGRRVRTLVDGELAGPGRFRLLWDGMDENGRVTAAGIYFVRLASAGEERIAKVMRIR